MFLMCNNRIRNSNWNITRICNYQKGITEGTRDGIEGLIDEAFDEWDKKSQCK